MSMSSSLTLTAKLPRHQQKHEGRAQDECSRYRVYVAIIVVPATDLSKYLCLILRYSSFEKNEFFESLFGKEIVNTRLIGAFVLDLQTSAILKS